ncbi:hypothetical protein ACQUSR_02575 [Streptomyces sp. P1-3]
MSVWMPKVRAGIAAGISVASWKSAVLRTWLPLAVRGESAGRLGDGLGN